MKNKISDFKGGDTSSDDSDFRPTDYNVSQMNISAISTTNEVKKYNKEIQFSNNTDANANEN